VRATAVTAQTSELVNIAPSADTDFGGAELFPATVAAAVAATSCEHATTTALATDLVDERTSANVPRGDPLAFGAGARLGAAAIAAIAAGEGVDRGVLVRLVAVGDVDVVAVRDVEVRDVDVVPVRDVDVVAVRDVQVRDVDVVPVRDVDVVAVRDVEVRDVDVVPVRDVDVVAVGDVDVVPVRDVDVMTMWDMPVPPFGARLEHPLR